MVPKLTRLTHIK